MAIRITVLLLLLFGAACPAGAIQSMFLDAVKKLPVELSLVKNCGTWEADGQRGFTRMIVADVGNGVGNELYVQWIAVEDTKPLLLTTTAFPELNDDHGQYAFKSAACEQRGSATFITIEADYEHDEADRTHLISIELGGVGTYRLEDKVKPP